MHKFDDGFYQKIQNLTQQQTATRSGDASTYDDMRYYSTIIVVPRDGGDGIGNDTVALENKNAVVNILKLAGALNITAAETLSFVVASVPVGEISGLTVHDEVYRLGDGELRVVSEVDDARVTIHATAGEISTAAGMDLNGAGIIVGVVDSGIKHDTAFGNRIIGAVFCDDDTNRCDTTTNVPTNLHGTHVAQVIAASGLQTNNGIAPGVKLLDIRHRANSAGVALGLDHAHEESARVVNMSFYIQVQNSKLCAGSGTSISSLNLIMDESVDKGMVVVKSAGNMGRTYGTITIPGCSNNVITVGGIDDNLNLIRRYAEASQGPIDGSILKPEIAAPAVQLRGVDGFSSEHVSILVTGTSYAAAQVSAASALILEARSNFTPVEVKAALLVGADWQGPASCTATEYERSDRANRCSHAHKPTGAGDQNQRLWPQQRRIRHPRRGKITRVCGGARRGRIPPRHIQKQQ